MTETDLYQCTTDELWKMFRSAVKDDMDIYKEEYQKVSMGIKIKFNIQLLTEERYKIDDYYGYVQVGAKKVPFNDFFKEKEEREDIMINVIFEQSEKGKVIERRV